jgi:hypothetical protein
LTESVDLVEGDYVRVAHDIDHVEVREAGKHAAHEFTSDARPRQAGSTSRSGMYADKTPSLAAVMKPTTLSSDATASTM